MTKKTSDLIPNTRLRARVAFMFTSLNIHLYCLLFPPGHAHAIQKSIYIIQHQTDPLPLFSTKPR